MRRTFMCLLWTTRMLAHHFCDLYVCALLVFSAVSLSDILRDSFHVELFQMVMSRTPPVSALVS